jgi:hypothetical protein
MSKKSKRKTRKKQVKSSNSKKLRIIMFVVILIAAGGYFFYSKNDRSQAAYSPAKTPAEIEALKGGETRPTLSPVLFVGKVARAYNVAGKNRAVLLTNTRSTAIYARIRPFMPRLVLRQEMTSHR